MEHSINDHLANERNISKPPVRISITETSHLFGISTKTIRHAIRRGEITYVVVLGRYKLNFESVLKWSQSSTRRRNLLAQDGIGRFVEQWKISNKKYSPREPNVS